MIEKEIRSQLIQGEIDQGRQVLIASERRGLVASCVTYSFLLFHTSREQAKRIKRVWSLTETQWSESVAFS